MPKVRCSNCKKRVDRSSLYRTQGLVKVCSPECFRGMNQSAQVSRSESTRKSAKKSAIPKGLRQEIYRRDRMRCRFCGSPSGGHVHHIAYRSEGGPHENWNLVVLCEEHHGIVHSNKDRYQPLLRGVVWAEYVLGRRLTVRQVEKQFPMEGT